MANENLDFSDSGVTFPSGEAGMPDASTGDCSICSTGLCYITCGGPNCWNGCTVTCFSSGTQCIINQC